MVGGVVSLRGVKAMENEIEGLVNDFKGMNLRGKELDDDPMEEIKCCEVMTLR